MALGLTLNDMLAPQNGHRAPVLPASHSSSVEQGGRCSWLCHPEFCGAPLWGPACHQQLPERGKLPPDIRLALPLWLTGDQILSSLGAVRSSAMGNRAGITGGTWCAFLQFSFCGHSLSPPSPGNKQWSGAVWGQGGSSLSNSSSSSAPTSPYKQTEVSLWPLNGCKRQHSSPDHPQAGPLSKSCLCHSTLTQRWRAENFNRTQQKCGLVICPWVTLELQLVQPRF